MSSRAGGGAALRGLAIAGAGLTAASTALADRPRDTPTAIEVDRDGASAGRVGMGFDDGEPVDAWGVSIAAGWVERPIELDADAFGGGSPATRPVRRRETLALGGALALGERAVVDLALRGAHQVGDRLRAAGNPAPLARWVVQDLKLGGRIRIAGGAARVALVRAELTLPTGNDRQFAGDARWTAAWSLIGRAAVGRGVAVAGTAGIRLHGAEVAVGDRLVGDALFGAVGVSVPLAALGLGAGSPAVAGAAGSVGGAAVSGSAAQRVAITAALLGALGDHIGDLSGPSPVEARMGAIAHVTQGLTIGAQLGVGLRDEIGSPRLRALVEVAWTPRVARRVEPARPPTVEEPDDADDDSGDPP